MLAAATVHFPYMTMWPERASAEHRSATAAGFARIGRAFSDAGIDTIIAVTSEHIVNLQPRLAPPFTIGLGDSHPAFPEPQFNLAPVARRGIQLSVIQSFATMRIHLTRGERYGRKIGVESA